MKGTCSLYQLLVLRLLLLVFQVLCVEVFLARQLLEQFHASMLAKLEKSQPTPLLVVLECLLHLRFNPLVPFVERLESCLNLLVERIAVGVSLYFDEFVLLRVRQEVGKVCHLEELLVAILLLADSSEGSSCLSSIWQESHGLADRIIGDHAFIESTV